MTVKGAPDVLILSEGLVVITTRDDFVLWKFFWGNKAFEHIFVDDHLALFKMAGFLKKKKKFHGTEIVSDIKKLMSLKWTGL